MANFLTVSIKSIKFGYQQTFCNIANSQYGYFWLIQPIPIADTIMQHQGCVLNCFVPSSLPCFPTSCRSAIPTCCECFYFCICIFCFSLPAVLCCSEPIFTHWEAGCHFWSPLGHISHVTTNGTGCIALSLVKKTVVRTSQIHIVKCHFIALAG